MRNILLFLLKWYQKIFTLFSYGSCRYYPTCSEYAKWRIENDNLVVAFFAIIFRIIRCNQLFKGGIEYPVVFKKFKNISYGKREIKYWFVPKRGNYFYLIKKLKGFK
jgi:putative membrane protein insertion efficiency factor